jgi:hypothetical protein
VRPIEIAASVLKNSERTVEQVQVKYVELLHSEMKTKNFLPNLRDILDIYNTYRDNTMSPQDFESVVAKQLRIGQVPYLGIMLLIARYRVQGKKEEERVSFQKLHKDLELCEAGIKPHLLWATEFSEDFIKALIVHNHKNPSVFLNLHARTRDSILLQEFVSACHSLRLDTDYKMEMIEAFFNQASANTQSAPLKTMIELIEKLFKSGVRQMMAQIIEDLFGQMKQNNTTIKVY